MSAELGFLVGGVATVGKLGKPLTSGFYGAIFWPAAVGWGIIAPLVMQLKGLKQGGNDRGMSLAAAGLAMMGGLVLRMLMVFAGRKSAQSPEDYFEYTRTKQG